MRDLTAKINDSAPASSGYLDAGEFNSSQEELENAVKAAPGDLTLDSAAGPDSSKEMLAQSITRHAAGGAMFCTAAGTASAHTLTMTDANVVAPSALFTGLAVRYDPPASNTGAVTVNAFSLGSKALVNHLGAPLSSGAIDGRVIDIFYDPSIGAGSWVLPAWSNALYVGQTPTSPPAVNSGEGWEVDGGNLGNLNFPGLTTDGSPQADDIFAFHDDADSQHKGISYAALSALLGTGGGILNMQLITASGTYTKTANTQKALVFCIGGGGGGGGQSYTTYIGSGGGGAGTAIALADLSAVSTVAVTIGAGGAGGVGGVAGDDGGSTSFGAHATAEGGEGGNQGAARIGGDGGEASVGLLKIKGGAGHFADHSPGVSGNGGSSFFGGGGRGGDNASSLLPEAGGGYGAGGGGADASQNGGAGAPGCVLVIEFA